MLDLVKVKSDIENNNDINLIIGVSKHKTSDFLFDHYLHSYANKHGLEILVVDTLDNLCNTFTIINDNIIYVYYCEHLDRLPVEGNNVWIRCKSIDKKLSSSNVVELIKLEDWQIKDYISTKNKITNEQANKLIKAYKDLYKLDIESKKLLNNKFTDIEDQLFYDNSDNITFDLVNSLVKRDKNLLSKLDTSNIELFGFLALLIKNFRLVIDIQLAKNATAESLNISGKQFWAVKNYSCGKYSREELLYIYKFLTNLDLEIKIGKLDTDIVVDYIISKFIYIM